MLRPEPRSASACRSSPMICSGVWCLPFILESPFAPSGALGLSYHLDQVLGSTPVRPAGAEPVQPVLRASRTDGGEPGPDAADRPAVHGLPVLRQPQDDGLAASPGARGQPQAGTA